MQIFEKDLRNKNKNRIINVIAVEKCLGFFSCFSYSGVNLFSGSLFLICANLRHLRINSRDFRVLLSRVGETAVAV